MVIHSLFTSKITDNKLIEMVINKLLIIDDEDNLISSTRENLKISTRIYVERACIT